VENIDELTKEVDIIETDEDTFVEDKSDDGGLYPYDPAYTDIEISETPFSVYEYLRQLNKGKIVIQPDFQRNEVWNPTQKSKFIESIILNFPLPPIYLNETTESKYIVIDGLQRTTALFEYCKNDFALSGIEALPKYNNDKFEDLPEILRSKIEDKKLTVFVLKPSTPLVVIYDLFNRINTGGTQLNRQEVRNCIFIGHSTKLLKELSEEDYFKQAIDNGVSPKRMKDREVILRYISFRWSDYKSKYTGDMSEFVEKMMVRLNKSEIEELNKIKNDFKRVMNWSFKIWGKKNFRIPTEKSKGTINTAVLESVSNYLSYQSDNFLEENRKTIELNYSNLIEDQNYFQSVTRSTGNKTKVMDRFRIVHELLHENTKS